MARGRTAVMAIAIALSFGHSVLGAGSGSGPAVTIAPFANGCSAAVSFTFDDGHAAHARSLVPLLDKYGFRATFFLISSQVPEEPAADDRKPKAAWAEWRAVAERGHEIGSHSVTHMNLGKVSDEAILQREVVGSADAIESKIGIRPVSFAYAFCAASPEAAALVSSNYAIARRYHPQYEGKVPIEKAVRATETAISNGVWHVWLSHGAEAETFDAYLQYLSNSRDRVWVDTYASIHRYVEERRLAQLEVHEYADDHVTVSIHLPETMDRSVYDLPLTITIPAVGTGPSYRSCPVDGSRATFTLE